MCQRIALTGSYTLINRWDHPELRKDTKEQEAEEAHNSGLKIKFDVAGLLSSINVTYEIRSP